MEFSEMKRNTSNWRNFCMLPRRAGLPASAGLSCLFLMWAHEPVTLTLITSAVLCYVIYVGLYGERGVRRPYWKSKWPIA